MHVNHSSTRGTAIVVFLVYLIRKGSQKSYKKSYFTDDVMCRMVTKFLNLEI